MQGYSRLRTVRGLLANKPLFLVLGFIMIAATGCVESRARFTPVPPTPAPTETISPAPTVTPTVTPIPPTATPVPTATPLLPTATPVPTVSPTPTPAPVPTVGSGTFNLTLNFVGVGEEGIVRSDTVLLRGITSTDAIVSVNDVIVEVQADGSFELTLVLDPGPNFVDVVASNLDGSTINSSLAIVSDPPEETP